MPSLSRITATFFVTLINRLGVRPPPPNGFELINTVQPVTIVDTDVALSAVLTTQTLDVPFTAGVLAAAAANTVLADSGAQVAGTYQVFVQGGKPATAGAFDMRIQRRDAANAVTVWEMFQSCETGGGMTFYSFTMILLVNERIRVIENTLSTTSAIVNLWLQKIG